MYAAKHNGSDERDGRYFGHSKDSDYYFLRRKEMTRDFF